MPEREHRDEQIQRASTHDGERAETLEPHEFDDTAEPRATPHADAQPDEAGMSEAVGIARRNGRSSNHAAIARVVAGDAARQRTGATGARRR
jgi:hypothetical protein